MRGLFAMSMLSSLRAIAFAAVLVLGFAPNAGSDENSSGGHGGNNSTAISDPSNAAYKVSVTPYGELSVFTEPANFFQDTFDSGSRDTNNWAAPTAAGGGVLAVWSSGNLQLASGTTAAGYSYATTVPTFRPTQPGYLRFGFAINLPAALPTNTYAAWGNFTPTATPTNPPTAGSTTGPIQEGCAFEALPGNKLYIACYAGNVRTQIADISASWPTDSKTHLWTEDFRGDLMAWYLGSSTAGITDPMTRATLATQQNGVNGPNINTQPITILTIGGAGTPSSSLVTNVAAIWVGVTNNTQRLCDGTYAFRCATVTGAGNVGTTALPDSSAAAGIAPGVAGAAVDSAVLKASPGNFYGVTVVPTSSVYVFVINATSKPANATLTVGTAAGNLQECFGSIPANAPFAFTYGSGPPAVYSTGITVVLSSTACPILTASAVGLINGRAK